jgi:hypothetical protein
LDHYEKREWGRIKVHQALTLRSGKDRNRAYAAIALDVSEENIGIETEAVLEVGERIQLELAGHDKPIVVQAVVKRTYANKYGCRFAEDDYGKAFSYYETLLHSVNSMIAAISSMVLKTIGIS